MTRRFGYECPCPLNGILHTHDPLPSRYFGAPKREHWPSDYCWCRPYNPHRGKRVPKWKALVGRLAAWWRR